jgi:ABC-2 type transport system permease protein
MSVRIALATTLRVLNQLRRDRRTIVMLLVVPSILITLLRYVFNSELVFNRIALPMLGVFPFITMFLVTSVTMLRERTTGTLERLLTTPLAKLDLLIGYGIAFALLAALQAGITCGIAFGFLGLDTVGSAGSVILIAVIDAILGMALGLLVSAFARTEFQAVQFMPAIVLPQILLCGLFVPRNNMAPLLEAISNVLPLSYAVEALKEVGTNPEWTDILLRDILIVFGVALLCLILAAITLRRRTA